MKKEKQNKTNTKHEQNTSSCIPSYAYSKFRKPGPRL